MHETIRHYAVICTVGVLLAVLSLWCWFGKDADFSESERRTLAQLPEFSRKTVFSGSFMSDFEGYAADQFPQRDSFRALQSFAKLGVFRQADMNGLYVQDGYLAQQQYPLSQPMLDHAAERFQWIYDNYLANTNSHICFSIVPDKHYFLSKESGRLSLSYEQLVEEMCSKTEYMQYIDIFPYLEISDYYRTDTHWRQECIVDIAQTLAMGMGTRISAEYETQELSVPFYGVYSGQLALPVQPDVLYYQTNSMLEGCTVTSYNTGAAKPAAMYDMDKAQSRDPYEMFLGGADALLTIENPNAATNKELILFRDSFGSSLAPYLAEGYRKITLVDIRYIQPEMLGHFIEFEGQDVLFLYSTLILNNSLGLR